MTEQGFRSTLHVQLTDFLAEKRAVGYRYVTEEHQLHALDRHLVASKVRAVELPRAVVEAWVAKRTHERATTQRARASVVKQFARFLRRHGYNAHQPDTGVMPIVRQGFAPRIFTRAEIEKFLAATVILGPDSRAPKRHLIMPELFRVLYGCGLRCGEALHLSVSDVDLKGGVFTVRGGKFRKDRLVPMSRSLMLRLRTYARRLGDRAPEAIFFPAPHGGAYSLHTPYVAFRRILRAVGIPHGGRGRGPRVHDLRHTFAVHRLERWCRERVDLGAKLPVLATFMGHLNLYGTQRYLHLTAELFPEIASRMEACAGALIPRLGCEE
jgi:integrase